MPDEIARHYRSHGIAGRILAALRAARGADVAATPDLLAPADHFHSRGAAATAEMLERLAPRPGWRLLDIGCGIAGPARWIASKAGCAVFGIDLTEPFCRAAVELNEATGLSNLVAVACASATALPFGAASFDAVYSQNVAMNVADKAAYFGEAGRVLKPGGLAAFTCLGAGPGGPPRYPLPWAQDATASFLSDENETRRFLAAAGLEIVALDVTTNRLVRAHQAMRAKIAAEGRPALSVQLLMGERMWAWQDNVHRSLVERRLVGFDVLARRS